MEQWQKEFIDFMSNIGEYDDLCYAISMGKNDKRVAKIIMNYIKENDINTFGMWEEDSGEKYDKYEKFVYFLIELEKDKN